MISFVNLTAQREKYRFELEKAEREVLDSGCYIGGPQVQALEKELSEYLGENTHAITCASGTDALTIALMTMDLHPGDEVIVPDFTFIAPAECVALLGGIPQFADIDRETLQIDPKSVKKLISKRTKGIIAVNLFGQCAPFKELREIATKHKLWIIEDSAQAFGARTSQMACTFGDIAITSFYPSKPLGCYGDGGALFTANEAFAQKIRMIANHGSAGRYQHEIAGMNSRLDALQAAVLRVKLKHLDEELVVRRQNAAKYDEFFAEYNCIVTDGQKIVPQKIETGCKCTYAQYTVLAENRESFIQKLKAAEIPYCIHYPAPLQEQPCFKVPIAVCGMMMTEEEWAANQTGAEWASEHAISLPVCAFTDVAEIIEKLKAHL
ncbi:UDP-2-acetamido-2-deoxy-ribo-hexuluronate aminotransferase [Fibrobacter sp. UWT2]|uniref:DegT/DnrJ/EryC1/StrS family aminotransferase n=1 Tax=Fibrobacter sp. UWT2 TaxID=1896224 RepID=UPI00091606D5|nr:DegT/DnrJ/EryC1/StrS family aminotransferase [Fibrobacter sp. UWT2]SHK40901.1 UDP-2-acetamido-2-deoxy-ribo-hexuluronate aminotransferase [Fibrobacter sp. UWT2]